MPICPRGHDSQAADYCDFCGWPISAPPAPQPVPAQASRPGGQAGTAGLVNCPICATPQTGRYCEECGYDYDLASPPQGTARPQPPAPQPTPQQAPPPRSWQPSPESPPYGVQYAQQAQQYVSGQTMGGDFRLEPPSRPTPGPQTGQQQAGPQGDPGYLQYQPQPPRPTTWVAVIAADRDYFDDMMARSGPDAAGLYFPPYSPERRVPMTGRGQLRVGRRSHQRGTVPEIDLSVPPEDPGASHQHALLQEQPDGGWVVIDQDSTNGTTLNGAADPIPAHTPVALKDGDRIHVGAWTTITVLRA